MMTFLKVILMFSCFVIMFSTNPVKTSMSLLAMSSVLFIFMHFMGGTVWLPSLYFLIFMGGILIMFMILSSIMPNEKTKKLKLLTLLLFTIMLMCCIYTQQSAMTSSTILTSQMKLFMYANQNLIFAGSLISTYFFLSMKILNLEKSTLRSELCCKMKKIL